MNFRIGKLSYLNNLPMYYTLLRRHPPFTREWTFVEGSPSQLNAFIREGEIDLSVVSSIEYAKNFKSYFILPNLSISSDGPVQSVLLFSWVPMEKLHEQPLLVSSASETSMALMKIILTRRHLEPCYLRGKIPESGNEFEEFSKNFQGLLVIGDYALQLKERSHFPFVYDLGEEWRKLTGLPFVFALWVVKRNIFFQRQEIVLQVLRALQESRTYSLAHLDELIAFIQKPADVPDVTYIRYFQNLRYELTARYQEGLKRYYHFLWKLGEIPYPVYDLTFVKEAES
ncbi:MAG: menaquinone biosynthesis protein [bacterium]